MCLYKIDILLLLFFFFYLKSQNMSYTDFDDEDEMSDEDNMDEENLTPLERLQKYKNSNLLLQR